MTSQSGSGPRPSGCSACVGVRHAQQRRWTVSRRQSSGSTVHFIRMRGCFAAQQRQSVLKHTDAGQCWSSRHRSGIVGCSDMVHNHCDAQDSNGAATELWCRRLRDNSMVGSTPFMHAGKYDMSGSSLCIYPHPANINLARSTLVYDRFGP